MKVKREILKGPVSVAKEFGCCPGNDWKHFKFWRNVVIFTYASFIERKWKYKGSGGNKQKKPLRGQISKSS